MIHLKTPKEIDRIRTCCQIVVECLRIAKEMVKPGVKTSDIDKAIEKHIKSKGAKPAFKGYRGFPASACISIDSVVVHGIPKDDLTLEKGQIVGIDIGVFKDKYYGDSAMTLPVGEIDEEKQRLMKVTLESLYQGISKASAGNRLHDISWAVQNHVESQGYSVVRDLVGHGIGQSLHEEPQVPNFGEPGTGVRLKKGMTLCIEPMVNAGTYRVRTEDDQWTVRTEDRKPSAHFEHTIAIGDGQPEILTQSELF